MHVVLKQRIGLYKPRGQRLTAFQGGGLPGRRCASGNLKHHISRGDLEFGAAESYFTALLNDCGIGRLPDDWRIRVRVGSDRNQSGTARENLRGLAADVPDELPDTQKKLVDFAAPGLRRILGYE